MLHFMLSTMHIDSLTLLTRVSSSDISWCSCHQVRLPFVYMFEGWRVKCQLHRNEFWHVFDLEGVFVHIIDWQRTWTTCRWAIKIDTYNQTMPSKQNLPKSSLRATILKTHLKRFLYDFVQNSWIYSSQICLDKFVCHVLTIFVNVCYVVNPMFHKIPFTWKMNNNTSTRNWPLKCQLNRLKLWSVGKISHTSKKKTLAMSTEHYRVNSVSPRSWQTYIIIYSVHMWTHQTSRVCGCLSSLLWGGTQSYRIIIAKPLFWESVSFTFSWGPSSSTA